MSIRDEIAEKINSGSTYEEVALERGIKRKTVINRYNEWKLEEAKKQVVIKEQIVYEDIKNEELEDENERLHKEINKLSKSRQGLMDSNRTLRAQSRRTFRSDNDLEDLGRELIEANKKASARLLPFSKDDKPYTFSIGNKGIIQLSDLHFNEIIDMEFNQYNPEVCAKRLKLFILKSVVILKSRSVTEVYLVNTGDIMNSSRRKSEITNQYTNRADASIILQDLLIQVILELKEHFLVKVISVQGNESRLEEDWDSTNFLCSDGFDYIVFANIKQQFEFAKVEGVEFISIDKLECIFTVNDVNILATHDCSKFTSTQSKCQSKIGGYYTAGKHVDFILSGHIHSTLISDFSSRSASIAGTNEYAWNKLGLSGKASQNLYVVDQIKNITKICVELQNTNGIIGYNVKDRFDG